MITISEDEWEAQQSERSALQEQVQTLTERLTELTQELLVAQHRIQELEAKKTPPPAFVKANQPEQPKSARKKRATGQNRARQCATPTHIVPHLLNTCPECQGRLSGKQIGRTRQVIEIAPPPPVEIIEHQVERGWCSFCKKWREAALDLEGQVVGQSRFGVRLTSLITTMRMALRLPIRGIQQWLVTMYRLPISVGAIADLLQRVAQHVKPAVEHIRDQIRARPAVNADETSWRENGRNGYIWAMGTPEGEAYFERHASRSGQVIQKLLGEDFTGVLTTDFYAGYNDTPGGKHQRCWVHLLRDLHALKEDHPQHDEVQAWAISVRQVYEHAVAARDRPASERQSQREHGEHRLRELGQQYGGERPHPCHALAQRLLRHQGELLVFLTAPGVEPRNNRAERLVRPLVVARKISGGARSKAGTDAHMILASLVQTCQAKARNVFEELLRLCQTPLPQL